MKTSMPKRQVKPCVRGLSWLLQDSRWVWAYVLSGALVGASLLAARAQGSWMEIGVLPAVVQALIDALVVGPILLFSLAGATKRGERLKPVSAMAVLPEILVIIPAHNESRVIFNSVSSLLGQDYPKDKIRVLVAFNGTDDTGVRAHALGAEVISTPVAGIGKTAAIQYVLDRLPERTGRLVCILDADNIVAPDYMRRIAAAFRSPDMLAVQGNHQALPRSRNWVSCGLAAAYAASSALYNPGRDRLLGSALLCGTGYVIRESVFRHLWPLVRTQTEDIEMNGLLECHYGAGVSWVADARFYDEKPDTLRIAIRQRVRWMIGHFRTGALYSPRLMLRFLRTGSLRALELALYYLLPPALLLSVVWYGLLLPGLETHVLHSEGPLPLAGPWGSAIVLFYLFGLPVLGVWKNRVSWSWSLLVRAVRDSVYAAAFALIVWPIALALATLGLGRRDWIFHTPHGVTGAVPQAERHPA